MLQPWVQVKFQTRLKLGDFYCLLKTLANCLDPDQDGHIVGPDLDPNRLFIKDFF